MQHFKLMSSLIFVFLFHCNFSLTAQSLNRLYRIAKIKVDGSQLEKYTAALQEQMKTAIKLEPGVCAYTAVADKKDSTSILILEVYADLNAYQKHIKTAHFLKYKERVKDMVLSLELMDTNLICSAQKEDW